MRARYLRQWLVIAISLTSLIVFFQNCGMLVSPKAPDQSASSMSAIHGLESVAGMACMECHENDRKDPDHYAGQDCKSCHSQAGWGAAGFAHNPMPASCNSCHASAQKHDAFPAGHLDIGTSDCKSCHSPGGWKAAGFAHNPIPTSCNSCHADGQRNDAFLPTHFAIGTSDCKTCHSPGTWAGAKFDHGPSVLNDRNCNSCHEKNRPVVVNNRNVNPSINDGRVIDKTHFANKDCFSCHTAPSGATRVTWRGANAAQYEHSDALGANLTYCLSCHMTDEHVGNDGSNADDIVGDGKCQQCHQRQRSWNDRDRNPNL